jgi:hypothetical protein
LPHEIEAVQLRHGDVGDDGVELAGQGELEAEAAVVRRVDVVFGALERAGERREEVRVIVDEEHASPRRLCRGDTQVGALP